MSTPRRSRNTTTREPPRARVGCSGWLYKDWRGRFYPATLPQKAWLSYYAREFDTVEINGTFYRLPGAERFAAWRKTVPAGFLFAVKASRFLTHMKRLREPDEPIRRLFARTHRLDRTSGPTLYQLPTGWKVDVSRLHQFLRALPRRRRHAIEFRDPTWYTEEVYALLARFRVALCLHDMEGSATGRLAIGPFAYVRFHGTPKYVGRYTARSLEQWANWLDAQLLADRPVFAYFNNTTNGQAVEDAIRLRAALDARRAAREFR
jgi:uncharacterized protein YecE (DUF72 family)